VIVLNGEGESIRDRVFPLESEVGCEGAIGGIASKQQGCFVGDSSKRASLA
jgi:hypothetical protein